MSGKEEFLRKVAVLCLKNAEQFVKDAVVLVKKRSYGHAFALAVFAEEELAKAIMYRLCGEGIFGIEGKWTRDVFKHERKQEFAFGMAFAYEQILAIDEAVEFAERKAKKDAVKFKQVFEKKMAEIFQKKQGLFASKRGESYKHLKHFEALQGRREKAMYVEADLHGEKVSCPKDFRKSEAKQYISHVEERIEAIKDEIKGKMKLQDKQRAMSLMKERLNLLDEETKRKQLEWYGLSIEDLDKFDTAK